MGTRTDISREVLDAVGTADNVRSLEHCTTRLRFGLVHPDRADTARIEALPGVISVVERGGQYQVVVGNDVADVYGASSTKAPQLAAARVQDPHGATGPDGDAVGRSLGRRATDAVFDYISGTFSPLLWALVGASLIKTLLALLTTFGILGTTGGTYAVLAAAGDAVFFFPGVRRCHSGAEARRQPVRGWRHRCDAPRRELHRPRRGWQGKRIPRHPDGADVLLVSGVPGDDRPCCCWRSSNAP